MSFNSNPEPTLVLYKSKICRHCTALTNIWDTAPNKDEDSVVTALKKVYPKLRFYILTANDNTGKFDENTAPKDLIRYGKWYPMILLIPGRLWDNAMSKLGPKNDIELVEGVQIMNGKWDKTVLTYSQEYDIRKPANFGIWLKSCLENEDFKKIQNGTIPANIVVPTVSAPSQTKPIQPILSNIIKPHNTSSNYVMSGSSSMTDNDLLNNICSMRIISRPR